MPFVPGDDVRQGPGTDGFSVRNPTTGQSCSVEPTQQCKRRGSGQTKLFNQTRQSTQLEIAGSDVVILFESWQRCCVPTGHAKQPVSHDSLRIHDVAGNVLDGPLSRRTCNI